MEFYIDASAKTKKFIEAVLPSMLTQLKLNSSKKLLHIKVDKEIDELGLTIPFVGIDTILVVLKPTKNWSAFGVTLAHEMMHVAQLAKGTLKITPKGKKWKGKFYGRSVAYLQQPWEVQAFSQQELIFRRAID
jgi:hypothetical protein